MDKIKVYGIDLGTTYSAISYLDDAGTPIVIQNTNSNLLASAVYFQEGGDPVVGEAAKRETELHPDRVVQFIKREIGKEESSREFDGKTYNAIEISSLILRQLADYANAQGHDVKNVVISCPAYFGEPERKATEQAGELAGLNVLNLINEPTAAAYNYLRKEFKESKKILVYDLGGGTFDVSYINYKVEDEKTIVDVVSSEGDDKLGGRDWDQRLFNHIRDLYIRDPKSNCSAQQFDEDLDLKQKVKSQIEDIKVKLSSKPSPTDKVVARVGQLRLDVERGEFEILTGDLLRRTMDVVKNVLNRSKISKDDIDLVLLVGGSTKMPMVQNAVKEMFGGSKVKVEEPDEAVVKGAVLAAGAKVEDIIGEIVRASRGSKTLEEAGIYEQTIKDLLNILAIDEDGGELIRIAKDLENAKPALPTIFDDDTLILIDRLSRSFGPAILKSRNSPLSFIDNLLFIGDETPLEKTAEYRMTKDGLLAVELYESRLELGEEPIILTDAQGNSVFPNSSLAVRKIGELICTEHDSKVGDPVEVYIRAESGGLDFRVKLVKTGEIKKAYIKSTGNTTMTPEEFEASKRKMDKIHDRDN